MRSRFLVTAIGCGILISSGLAQQSGKQTEKDPVRQSNDMQRAIAFERHKDAASARQARLEARHPSVPAADADRSADRSADRTDETGNTVKDPGPQKER